MSEIIGGINPVLEALQAEEGGCDRVYVAQGRLRPALQALVEAARGRGVRVDRLDRAALDRLFGGGGHQGVVARVSDYRYASVSEILERAGEGRALILALDRIQDPMNLGSLLRSAEAAGAAGVIVPRDHAAPVSATVRKASAGAAAHLAVVRVANLVQTMLELKEEGFWIVGADQEAEIGLFDLDLPERLVLAVGGEGPGLRRLVKETCDRLVSIPLAGRVRSLNAGVAGAIVLFEYVRQSRREGPKETRSRASS
jgi:23S rRNA (guanosine2251-2'-O)-methyltransferase